MSLSRLLGPLQRRMATLIGRAVLSAVQSAPGCQTMSVTILADEPQTDVEHMEPYGYTSNPPGGAEGLILNVAGQRGAAVGINFGNRAFRLTGLKNGEVALYTDEGDKIVLKRDHNIEVTTLHCVINAEKDYTVNTESYTVNASNGATYNTPSYNLGGEGGCKANIDADMGLNGDIVQEGSHTSTGDQTAAGISQVHHTHPGDSGGSTGQPV